MSERSEHPTGADLVEELRVAAVAAGISVNKFVEPIASGKGSAYLTQLAMAKLPSPLTIARVRALLDGKPIPSHRGGGNPDGQRCAKVGRPPEVRVPGSEIEHRRQLTELAHEHRRPGETIAAAVKRLQHSQAMVSELQGMDA